MSSEVGKIKDNSGVYMKELISLYVSLFLIFSPLFGQTKQEATIYMTNGYVGKVTVIEIGEEVIVLETISSDGQLLKQAILKYMIYKLLSPDGNSLYTNPDTKEEYEKTSKEFKVKKIQNEQLKQSSEYAMSFESEREYIQNRISSIRDIGVWTSSHEIITGKIFTITDSSLAVCEVDSCYNWRSQPVITFDYSEINKVVVMKKDRGSNGAGMGFLVGAVIGAVFGFSTASDCEICDVDPLQAAVVFGIIFGIPGALIGGIGGANREEHYTISGNLQAFKKLHKKIDDEVNFYELPENKLIQDQK